MNEEDLFDAITPLPEGGPWELVELQEGFAVPRRFVASGEEISIEVEINDAGHAVVRRLEVRDRDGSGLTSEAVRKFAVGRLRRKAVAAASRPYEAGRDGEPVFRIISGLTPEAVEFYRSYVREDRRPRRGALVQDSDLQAAVDIYRAALERGDPPTQAVAKGLSVSRPTASRRLEKAREKGLMGPALPGRAGELKAD